MMPNSDPPDREKTHYDYGDPWNRFSLYSQILLIRRRFYFEVSKFQIIGK